MSIAAGTLGYQRGLTAKQVAKLSAEEKMEYMKFITELRKTIEQLKMETVESYAQVAGIEAQVLAEVTSAYLQARAQGDDARATALSGLSSSLTERIRQMRDPDPAFQKKIEKDAEDLTKQVFNTARNIAKDSEDITPQQLVDNYFAEMEAGNQKELGNLQIAAIRNKAAAQNALPGTGAESRGLTMLLGRNVIENSIEQGLITAGLEAGLDPDLVTDAYLQKQKVFRDYIGLEPKEEDIKEVDNWARRNFEDIQKIQKDLKSAGTSLDTLDYYVSVVKPGNLGDLIAGGPSKLTEQLKDEVVAPETAKFIKDLQAELQASVEAKDVFDRAIDAYSKIPGANQLRTALGLGDDYKFSYYVSRNPGAFNEALKGVKKAADDADRDVNTLKTAEMRGLIANVLASDRRESPEAQVLMAKSLARQPGRMRRIMRRQARKADRDLAKEIAAGGLSRAADVAGSGVDVAGTGKDADVDLSDIGTGVGGEQPKVLSAEERRLQRIAQIKEELRTATGADADELRRELAELEGQTRTQPTQEAARTQAPADAEAEAAAVKTITGEGVAAQKDKSEEALKKDMIEIIKEMGAYQAVDAFLTTDQLAEKYNMQVGGATPVVTPDPVDQYLSPSELDAKYSGVAVGNRLGESPVPMQKPVGEKPDPVDQYLSEEELKLKYGKTSRLNVNEPMTVTARPEGESNQFSPPPEVGYTSPDSLETPAGTPIYGGKETLSPINKDFDIGKAARGITLNTAYRPYLDLSPDEVQVASALEQNFGGVPKNPNNLKFFAGQIGFNMSDKRAKALGEKLTKGIERQKRLKESDQLPSDFE